MSFIVGNNTANYLSDTTVVASYPFAVHVWARANTSAGTQILWCSERNANNHFAALLVNSNNDVLFSVASGGSGTNATTSDSGFADGAWFSALVVGISATERYVYLNGVAEGTSTTSRTISSYVKTQIARSTGGGFPTTTFDGDIADVCYWQGFSGNPFTADLRQALALGISPLLLTQLLPSVVSYLQLINDSQGNIGPDYTENGTVVWSPSHPTLYLPPSTFARVWPEGPTEVEDTVAVTEDVELSLSRYREVMDSIALDESIATIASLTIGIGDTIDLTEDALRVITESEIVQLEESVTLSHGRTVTDTIALSDESDEFVGYSRSVEDTIDLSEDIDRVIFAGDTLTITDFATHVYSVEDTISLHETLFNSDRIDVIDIIDLTDSALPVPIYIDSVQLFESVDLNLSRDREADDNVALFETLFTVINAACPTCCDVDEDYHPYVGATTNPALPTPPAHEAPTLVQSHSIVLSHPVDTPTLSVTLRAPDFGNREHVENKRIHRESRGGTLIIYADPQWPKIHLLVMDFSVLKESVAQEYLAFRAATLGQQITLVDHESREWVGVLLEVDTPVVRNRRGGITASLVFEGELA